MSKNIENLELPGLSAASYDHGVMIYPAGDNYDCASLDDLQQMIALRDWLNSVIAQVKP